MALILAIMTAGVQAQNANRLKLAQTFLQNSDFKNAEKIFAALYAEKPSDENIFWGYSQSLYAQNKFSELLPITDAQLKLKPSLPIYCLNAEVNWKLGKQQEAVVAWEKATKLKPKDSLTYAVVAKSMHDVTAFDNAIATLLAGRKALRKPAIYADVLSDLYMISGNNFKAADEILVYYANTENLRRTQGKLQAMLTSDEIKDYLRPKILDLYRNGPHPNIELYGWFLVLTKEYDAALQCYIEKDKRTEAHGAFLYPFATAREREGNFDIALKAYAELIDMGKVTPYMVNALFGYTRTLEKKNEAFGDISRKDYDEIIDRYRNIVKLYSKNSVATEAMFRIAAIQADKLHNLPEAIKEYENIRQVAKNQQIALTATNKLGDIYFELDSVARAKEYYQIVANSKSGSAVDARDYAKYALGEMCYFDGELDSATAVFTELSANTESVMANDALEKIFFIEQNKNQNKAIRLYASAEKFERQKKFALAIDSYNQAKEFGDDEIRERSMLHIADIYKAQLNFADQRKVLKEFLEQLPESIFVDDVMFELAESLYASKDYDAAMKVYTKLLTDFPRSIYTEQVRQRIREIRAA